MAKFLKKAKQNAERAKGGEFSDKVWSQTYPAITEFLTVTMDGKEKRELSSLNFNVQGGRPTVFLNDWNDQTYTVASADTFENALEALERSLADGSAEWRERQGRASKRLGRGKKGDS